MAGTPRKIKQDFHDDSVVGQLVATVNALIAWADTHTHGGVTAGAANTAVPTAVTGAAVRAVTHIK